MKVWLKYILGIALGVAFAIILPPQSEQARAALDFVTDLVIRFGRYALVPMLFFSIATACFKLRDEKLMLKTGLWTFALIILSSLFLVALGLGAALLFCKQQIPMGIEQTNDIPTLDVPALLVKLFPYSGFSSLLNDSYLLPCFVFAGFIGAGAADDQAASRNAMALFTSLGKVCYNVMSFFTEILSVGMIAIVCRWTLVFIALHRLGTYAELFRLLAILLAIVGVVVYPLILRILCHEHHPFRVLYASIAPFCIAFFSADSNLVLPLATRHGKESLGIRHRVNAVTYPLFSIFARGGAALVVCVCFIAILRSYSLLKIERETIMWIGTSAFLLSFLLGEHPTEGPFLALTIMCMNYGNGFEAGFLLLRDAAPILCSFAAAFDVLTAMTGSYIVGLKTHTVKRQEIAKFI